MPRAGLTQDRLVAEAEQIADSVGLHRLTLAALADQVGVKQPSLYKHIEGMDELQRRISIRAKIELVTVLGRAAVGRSRGDAIEAIAKAYRTWAHEHPGRYAAAQRAPRAGDADDEVASSAVVQVVADVLAGFNLAGDDAIDAIRALRSTLHGFVSLEAAGGFGLPVDVDRSYDRLVSGFVTAVSRWNER